MGWLSKLFGGTAPVNNAPKGPLTLRDVLPKISRMQAEIAPQIAVIGGNLGPNQKLEEAKERLATRVSYFQERLTVYASDPGRTPQMAQDVHTALAKVMQAGSRIAPSCNEDVGVVQQTTLLMQKLAEYLTLVGLPKLKLDDLVEVLKSGHEEDEFTLARINEAQTRYETSRASTETALNTFKGRYFEIDYPIDRLLCEADKMAGVLLPALRTYPHNQRLETPIRQDFSLYELHLRTLIEETEYEEGDVREALQPLNDALIALRDMLRLDRSVMDIETVMGDDDPLAYETISWLRLTYFQSALPEFVDTLRAWSHDLSRAIAEMRRSIALLDHNLIKAQNPTADAEIFAGIRRDLCRFNAALREFDRVAEHEHFELTDVLQPLLDTLVDAFARAGMTVTPEDFRANRMPEKLVNAAEEAKAMPGLRAPSP